MTDKEIIIDGKQINCPCYIDRPLHRYNKGCLIQSQAFSEQQTQEKPILRCDEIKNCPIKEQYKQLKRDEQRIVELNKTIQAKEQECEELKKIIDEAKNSKLDLKSFLVGEAIQNEYEQQLDQLRKRNNQLVEQNFELAQKYTKLEKETEKLKQTLTEIKEIAEPYYTLGSKGSPVAQILQKISEVKENE